MPELDEQIHRALHHDGALAPGQKARAWERLAAAAAQQPILDPIPNAPSPGALRRAWQRLRDAITGHWAVRSLHLLALDEQCYCRASAYRHAYLSRSASPMGHTAQYHYVFSYYRC
ncbi:MAG: hypothetical protein CUN53_01610 [Phototrophicales bacterium]|nr:MAG: hypothetical protein CUN53_01610 [Phototrophicales bacterium]